MYSTVILLFASVLCGYAQYEREEILLGGLTPQDPDNPMFMFKAWKVTKHINDNLTINSGPYLIVPVKVTKAQSQVVSGTRYVFEVIFGESNCLRHKSLTVAMMATYCRPVEGGAKALYKIDVVEQSWNNQENYNIQMLGDVYDEEE
ncbi:unnamed protein product [Cylicocyclus nassatus]|uniref:Cystatin domain-containing protein n=1 Tax=Cylicocyclus nassatus TaxID=53992 RepID=A0AA36M4K0_CYLNA|nr:unnamed protein product [Cylicocyclus nassatus]